MGGRGSGSRYTRAASGSGAAGGSAGSRGPSAASLGMGTPQKPAANGFTGTVNGNDISNTWQAPTTPAYRGQEIEDVMDAQGFRGKPRIITDQAEFDKAAAAAWGGNGMVMVRGIGAPNDATLQAYSDSLTNGDWYVTCGGGAAHGYGQYAAYRYGSTKPTSRDLSEAQNYASWNGQKTKVFTMTLDPSAKIGEESKLRADMRAHNSAARSGMNAARQKQRQATAPVVQQLSNGTRAQVAAAKAWTQGKQDQKPRKGTTAKYQSEFNAAMNKLRKARDTVPTPTVFRDVGVYAAAKGYDFYYDRGTGYSVTLNRTKLIIKG